MAGRLADSPPADPGSLGPLVPFDFLGRWLGVCFACAGAGFEDAGVSCWTAGWGAGAGLSAGTGFGADASGAGFFGAGAG